MEQQSAITRVQSLAERGIQTVPLQYVRPREEIFNNINSSHAQDVQIPIIDLHGLDVQPLSITTVTEIASAAEKWGFFQIVNHGIPESLIARVQAVGKAFFELPMEEKEVYKSEGGGNHIGYGTKVGTSADAKLDWRDYYYNILWPVSKRFMSKWPKQPSDFMEVMDEYSKMICKLWEVLMQALCGGLGLANENALDEALGGERKEIHFTINYYPPCPQPEQVFGVSPHSDVDALTILLQDQIPGLQILKGDAWLDVPCIPGALVVNIGDQIEILSNGKYKSIEHRSFVHKKCVRMSWSMFCTPSQNVIISPLKELISEENPPLYGASSYQEYLEQFFIKGLIGKDYINELKCSSA
ncbi:flavonol synthase/flavanone 3-hydroxylase [Cryptomeria japonica]|uniref:flavonol synthase/flavanone 3-hydroxylase n=1 Tax=Cryptomeria japonica TaxID=3369 RepID=UPI0027DAB0D4|nr:flavonol synthase/flavanone 3-hydroxylase [Cryptomeria japonica]